MGAAAVAVALIAGGPAPPAAGAPAEDVSRIAVSFAVKNTNRSTLPCRTDELDYAIAGEVIGPARLLSSPRDLTATLYLHEFSFGKFFWSFRDVDGYDHAAEMARAGHVSVIVDRLGYDDSGHPPGSSTCFGAQADMAAQLVRQLKEGTYATAGGGSSIPFDRVILAGHSVGGGTAELAAHSFADLGLPGLILFAWADQGYSSRAIQQSLAQGADCAPGGEPAETGAPGGYAFYGRSEADFRENVFRDTDPAVVEAATRRRNRDPCGDNATLARMAVVNAVGVGSLTVPVLLAFGDRDAVFESGAADTQTRLFRSSRDVTLRRFAGAGHALMLERVAPAVRSTVAEWLDGHGFGSPRVQVAGEVQARSGPASVAAGLPETGPRSSPVAGIILVAIGLAGARRKRIGTFVRSCRAKRVEADRR